MTSPIQIAANRANSQNSTGPRTAEGKQRSRMNGYTHGLTGHTLVMTPEEKAAFDDFNEDLLECLAPANALELELAQSIAMDRWRLNRIKAIEQNIFAMDEEAFLKHAKQLNLLTLYESRISRGVERTMKQLKELQTERRTKRESELADAVLLYRLSEFKGLPFDPETDGFGFSTPEIARRAQVETARSTLKMAAKRAA